MAGKDETVEDVLTALSSLELRAVRGLLERDSRPRNSPDRPAAALAEPASFSKDEAAAARAMLRQDVAACTVREDGTLLCLGIDGNTFYLPAGWYNCRG